MIKVGNELNVEYQKVIKLDLSGNTTGEYYSIIAYTNYEEVTLGTYESFGEMARTTNPATILLLLEECRKRDVFAEIMEVSGGLRFAGKWFGTQELKTISCKTAKLKRQQAFTGLFRPPQTPFCTRNAEGELVVSKKKL